MVGCQMRFVVALHCVFCLATRGCNVRDDSELLLPIREYCGHLMLALIVGVAVPPSLGAWEDSYAVLPATATEARHRPRLCFFI